MPRVNPRQLFLVILVALGVCCLIEPVAHGIVVSNLTLNQITSPAVARSAEVESLLDLVPFLLGGLAVLDIIIVVFVCFPDRQGAASQLPAHRLSRFLSVWSEKSTHSSRLSSTRRYSSGAPARRLASGRPAAL